jgi:outer membrane protein assembly factor BamB
MWATSRWRFARLTATSLMALTIQCAFARTHDAPKVKNESKSGKPEKTGKPSINKDKVMTTASTNPVRFASPRRDSALSGTTAAVGKLTWSQNLSKVSSLDWPPTVLIWGDRPVVATAADLEVFDPKGERLGSYHKRAGTPAAVGQGRLYHQTPGFFLDALDATGGKALAESPFPGGSGRDVAVDLFWPRDEDFIAVVSQPGDSELAEGESPDKPAKPPLVTVRKNKYELTYGLWHIKYKGVSRLAPLLVPERGTLALMMDDLIRVDIGEDQELSRFKVPLQTLVEWSADTDEVYCFTGYQGPDAGGKKTLLAMSAAGHELWRWTDEEEHDPWAVLQPPIRGPGGRVIVLTQGRVLAFEAGKLRWQYDVLSASLKHGAHVDSGSFELKDGRLIAKGGLRHGAVLADGSVLATINKTLYHLSADGQKLFAVSVDEEILGPPVVDAAGHLYVATATHLSRID